MERILVIVDPTIEPDLKAQRAVDRGLMLAQRFGTHLELFVCDYNASLSGDRFFDSRRLAKSRKSFIKHRAEWLSKFAETLPEQGGVKITTDCCWDHPLHDGIVRKVLRWKPDLVLKDAHHHGRLQRAFFTNTDWHLLRDCPAPLLLVKTDRWRRHPKLVAAVDPTHAHDKPAALDHKIVSLAEKIAEKVAGELHVFHAHVPLALSIGAAVSVPDAVTIPAEGSDRQLEDAHRQALAELLARHDVPAERLHFEVGPVEVRLEELVEKLRASLVVMGVVARRALERLIVGSTAERTLGDLACDVLAVKPDGFVCPVAL